MHAHNPHCAFPPTQCTVSLKMKEQTMQVCQTKLHLFFFLPLWKQSPLSLSQMKDLLYSFIDNLLLQECFTSYIKESTVGDSYENFIFHSSVEQNLQWPISWSYEEIWGCLWKQEAFIIQWHCLIPYVICVLPTGVFFKQGYFCYSEGKPWLLLYLDLNKWSSSHP